MLAQRLRQTFASERSIISLYTFAKSLRIQYIIKKTSKRAQYLLDYLYRYEDLISFKRDKNQI